MQPLLRPSLLPILLLLLSLIPFSLPLSSPGPGSPIPAPDNLSITALMSKKGCKAFGDLLHSNGDAADSFASNLGSGLTAFCPTDPVMKPFLPRFKNLTADEKISLLLYHAVPIYYSIEMLKSNNGVLNTLATDGTNKNYNFTVQNNGEVVTLQTVTTAKITGTLFDVDPVSVYTIDAVLEPRELFRPVEAPAPAPAPKSLADSPKSSGKKRKHGSPPAPEGPAASPDEKAADQKVADDNNAAAAGRAIVGSAAAAAVVFALGFA